MRVGSGVVAVVFVLVSGMVLRGVGPHSRVAGLGLSRRPPAEGRCGNVVDAAARRLVGTLRHHDDLTPARDLFEAWSTQLRSGQPVDAALTDAFVDVPASARVMPRTCSTLSVGGDVGDALRRDAGVLVDEAARRAVLAAAACWTVAQNNGGRLADALDQIGSAVRADQIHVDHVHAQLAGPRSTGRLLAALPVIALFMSVGVGMNPVEALLTSTPGRLALVAGVALDLGGLWWIARLARSAQRAA